jgi:hypothetical protein
MALLTELDGRRRTAAINMALLRSFAGLRMRRGFEPFTNMALLTELDGSQRTVTINMPLLAELDGYRCTDTINMALLTELCAVSDAQRFWAV